MKYKDNIVLTLQAITSALIGIELYRSQSELLIIIMFLLYITVTLKYLQEIIDWVTGE